MSVIRKNLRMIFNAILCGVLIVSFLLDGSSWTSSLVKAATAVTEGNPISFSLGAKKDPTVTNGMKYSIHVNNVFDDGSITYKTVFISYPKTLQLITPSPLPSGFILNNNQSTGVATLVIDVETNPALSPAAVKSTLENCYFILKDANVFPPEGALVAISASKNKIAFYEDEQGYLHYYQFFPTTTSWMGAYNNAKALTMTDPFTGKVLPGYLATITSQEEQKMIYNSIAKVAGWLGGTRIVKSSGNTKISDDASISTNTGNYVTNTTTANQWYWSSGPEAWTSPTAGTPPYQYNAKGTGTPLVFWDGPNYATNPNAVPGVYANFNNPKGVSIINNKPGTGSEPNGGNEQCLQFAYNNVDTWNDVILSGALTYYVEYGGYPGDPNTNDLDASLSDAMVNVPMPVTVQYRSNTMGNGAYKPLSSIGTTFDMVLYGAENASYTVSPLATIPEGYMVQGVQFMGTSADKALLKVDGNNQATGQFSAHNQTIVFLYEIETPFTISVSSDQKNKIYKPNWTPTTATVRSSPLVKPDEIVQFLMVPTSDTEEITTEAQFNAKAATLAPQYKGQMHQTDLGMYNMYNLNDPNLNGVLDNCKLWVMAKGTKITNNSTVVAFDSQAIKNIYTPIDVFYQGKTTSGDALHGVTRVAVNGDTEARYGFPLDLDNQMITQPPFGYDEMNVVHRDLADLWNFNASYQPDLAPLVLDDASYAGKIFYFVYDKNSANWFSAQFRFENEDEPPEQLTSPQAIDDFIPYNGTAGISYLFGLDQYMPPTIPNYLPVGYSIDDGPLNEMSVPLKYGEIVLPRNNATVAIIYRQNVITIREEFHLFQRNADGVEEDLGEIPNPNISANVSYRTNGALFTGKPQTFDGYVYRGYSLDDGATYMEPDGYPAAPYNPYTALAPQFYATKDSTIIYKYKIDTTHTGTADEDIKTITTSGVGIDSHGNVVDTLYLNNEKAVYGTQYIPIPEGDPDGFGNPVVFVDSDGTHWILSMDPDLYTVTPFEVTKDTGIRFYYHKDSSKNGKADHLEANVTIEYTNKANATNVLDPKQDTEGTPEDSFTSAAPKIPKFVAVGVLVYKEGEAPGAPRYMTGDVKVEIPLLGENNWIVNFLYEVDANENGIPDSAENNNNNGGSSSKHSSSTRTESPIVLPTPSTPLPSAPPNTTTAPKTSHNSGRNTYNWATFEKPEQIFLDDALIPLSALVFNGPYLHGYPDNTIHPDGNLTRAEAAQIIYNLYGRPDEYVHLENPLPYTDVHSDAWYGKAVAFLTQYDFIKGYPDDTFRPNQPITRAELVTLLVKYNDIPVEVADETLFNDVVHHWAKPQINAAYKDNLLYGFADGTFQPDNFATRSEVVTIINNMLERPDRWIGENSYTDLNKDHWAYEKLMNAAYGYAEE